MASLPDPSSSSTTSRPSGDSKSSTANNGHIDGEAVHFSYERGELSWSNDNATEGKMSSGSLKDEDVVVVTKATTGLGHNIFSLAATEAADTAGDSSPKQFPFDLRQTSAANLSQEFLDAHLLQSLPSQLSPADSDIHVVISTLSGTGLAPPFFDSILQQVLAAVGLKPSDYNVFRTESTESVSEFARSVLLGGANKGLKQTCLMLSGDGGIVDAINGLLKSRERSSNYIKPTLSQFPLGTGNALFHSLHKDSSISSIYVQGLRTLLHGTPKPLPSFRATFSSGARILSNEGRTANRISNGALYGAVVASYGLHATLVADSDTTEYRKHGDKRFGLAANDLLFPQDGEPPHAYKADVTLFKAGGKQEAISRKEHGYVLATLVSNLEKAFTISPSSRPLDGQLRVVHFGATSGQQAMEIMKKAYDSGRHVGFEWEGEAGKEKVGYEDIDGIKINFREEGDDWKWRRCCIDGLIVGVEEGGWMEVNRVEPGSEAVNVLVDV